MRVAARESLHRERVPGERCLPVADDGLRHVARRVLRAGLHPKRQRVSGDGDAAGHDRALPCGVP